MIRSTILRRLVGAVMALTLPWIAVPLRAETLRVTTPAELAAALARAGAGDEIRLAPGTYGALRLHGGGGAPDAPLVLRSDDPADPAGFDRMALRGTAHLRLESLVFDYTFAAGDKGRLRPFWLIGVRDVTVTGALFDGDVARGLGPAADGFPTAFGLGIRGATGVTLETSEIRGFWRGLVVSESADVTVRGNDVHALRMDGMTFAQVDRVRIEDNRIRDFRRSPRSKDHADMIQFWTNGTTAPSRDVVIRDNVLDSGGGLFTQSIFMRNDLVDRGLAGTEMFYRDIRIEGNVISNAHLHGITVGETAGLRIANNTVLRNPRSQGAPGDPRRWTPQIRVAEASRDVAILRNVTAGITGHRSQPDWRVAGNVRVQYGSRLEPGHYRAILSGDPGVDLSSVRYRRGGPLDGAGVGAPRLDPGRR